MRRLLVCAVFLAGCGGGAPTVPPPTPDEEKAAEQRLKDEAQREGKGKPKKAKHNPDDD
jgi:hypothetical protein